VASIHPGQGETEGITAAQAVGAVRTLMMALFASCAVERRDGYYYHIWTYNPRFYSLCRRKASSDRILSLDTHCRCCGRCFCCCLFCLLESFRFSFFLCRHQIAEAGVGMVLSWLEGPAVTAIVDKVPTPPSFPTAVGVLLRWVASGCFTEAEVTQPSQVETPIVRNN
jgi:hypothetical protein